jgi:hypothetical protein
MISAQDLTLGLRQLARTAFDVPSANQVAGGLVVEVGVTLMALIGDASIVAIRGESGRCVAPMADFRFLPSEGSCARMCVSRARRSAARVAASGPVGFNTSQSISWAVPRHDMVGFREAAIMAPMERRLASGDPVTPGCSGIAFRPSGGTVDAHYDRR